MKDSQASDIWYVKTDKREAIVRTSRTEDIENDSCFFNSVYTVFGVDPSNVFALEDVNNSLAQLNAFIYPRITNKHRLDKEYVVCEFLKGNALNSFIGLSDGELKKFGRNLAKIHSHKMDYWGNPSGSFKRLGVRLALDFIDYNNSKRT